MPTNQPSQSPSVVLLVDDTPASLRLFKTILASRGYEVLTAENGKDGLRLASEQIPDLVMLDINMPDMDGYEVCEHLKEEESTKDIPVIFISGLNAAEDKVKAFDVGGVDYITKPFDIKEVYARVKNHLELQGLKNALEQRVEERTAELEERTVELEEHKAELEQRTVDLEKLNISYQRFVPREFLRILKKESIVDVNLTDHTQETMTIMFSDIRDFTMLSEKLSPEENFLFLTSYLKQVNPVIGQHSGFVDKYMGDAVMALFPNAAEDALNAAIGMQEQMVVYNEGRKRAGYKPISIGIALHTGSLMLGIIGGKGSADGQTSERLEATVISDAVNLASRLEGMTKIYSCRILASEETINAVPSPERFNYRFLIKAQVKGKREPVSVYEIFDGDPPDLRDLKLQTKPGFEAGLDLYLERAFAEAAVKFKDVLEANPNDKAARLYLERAANFMVNDVGPDWRGVETLTEK